MLALVTFDNKCVVNNDMEKKFKYNTAKFRVIFAYLIITIGAPCAKKDIIQTLKRKKKS